MAKTTAARPDKIECVNPNTGRHMQIDATTWNLFASAIKETLKGNKVLTYTEMVDGINDYIKKNKIKFNQSVGWYAVTVKHDLQVKGIISVFTEKGRKLHSLAKKEKK